MSSTIFSRSLLRAASRPSARLLTTPAASTPAPSQAPPAAADVAADAAEPSVHSPTNTHFKITLRRSGISMGKKVQGTLLALGFHRRHQTVFHAHGPEAAGKILRVKELVEVENVPTHAVMTPGQQRAARRPPRGYKVVGSRRGTFMGA